MRSSLSDTDCFIPARTFAAGKAPLDGNWRPPLSNALGRNRSLLNSQNLVVTARATVVIGRRKVTDTLMANIGPALELLLLCILPVFVILRSGNSRANASAGSSSFCNGEPTGGSIRLDKEPTVDLNTAFSDWQSASQSDEGFVSVYGFSDSQAGDGAEFDVWESGKGSLFDLGSPGLDDDHEEDLDIV
jgi:hypothetical protein